MPGIRFSYGHVWHPLDESLVKGYFVTNVKLIPSIGQVVTNVSRSAPQFCYQVLIGLPQLPLVGNVHDSLEE